MFDVFPSSQPSTPCLTNPSPQAGEPEDNIFAYDYLYEIDSQTESVYVDMAQPLVDGLFDGYNGTIFAYGQVSRAPSCAAPPLASSRDLLR